jgi:hypothetical protein
MTRQEANYQLDVILESLVVEGDSIYSIEEVTPGDFRIKVEDNPYKEKQDD